MVAPRVTALPSALPFPFEENVGQIGPGVGYLLRAGEMQVGFGAGELTYVLRGSIAHASTVGEQPQPQGLQAQAEAVQRWTVRQELVGATRAMPRGTVTSPTVVSYLKGGPDQWIGDVPAFQQVTYTEAWPGITVTFDQAPSGFKSTYYVAAGADPSQIRLLYGGADVRVDETGMLVAETPLGQLRESAPVAWQVRDGAIEIVPVRFDLLGEPTGDGTEYGFALEAYDPDLPLVIDPQVAYASFFGGGGGDQGRSVAVDASGSAYVTGVIDAPGVTFPGGPATFDGSHNGDWDAFAAKLNPAGTALVYASFVGGSGQDIGFGVALDGSGAAYIAGLTTSTEATFPTGSGVGGLSTFDGTYNGGLGDAFVVKVNASGTALLYAGFLGGSGHDQAQGIAVDSAGAAYITGYTESSQATFPTGAGIGVLTTFDGSYNGNGDAFVAKVNPAGTSLVYAGYVGGAEHEGINGIAIDAAGNAYITGSTESTEATFPTGSGIGGLPTIDGTYNGATDAFVVKIAAAGTSLGFASFIGGADEDIGYAVAADASGSTYVSGRANAPLAVLSGGATTTFDGTFNGSGDAFLLKLAPSGTSLVYGGYIGGNDFESGIGVAVDPSGNAYVLGYTASTETTFPNGTGLGAIPTFDGTANGGGDIFLAKVNANGASLAYAGFLGGNGVDSSPPWSTETGIGIAVDGAGNAYVTGRTNSTEASFPDGLSMSGVVSFDTTYGGGLSDAFIVKVTPGATCALAARQAAAALNYATYAFQYAYYDYVTFGVLDSYYALAYEYQAYVSSQSGYAALTSGNSATAKSHFNAAATHAYYGYQYAYAAYTGTGSMYAYNAYIYGYYTWVYAHQADVSC